MRFFLMSCVIGVSIFTDAFAEDQPKSSVLTGAEILNAFQGRKITDNAHYKYQLHEGGLLEGVEMYSRFTGKWYVQQDQLCWLVDDPQATEECFSVAKNGEAFNFSSDHLSWNGSVYPLDALPTPPEKI